MSILDVPGVSKPQLNAALSDITIEVDAARDAAQAFAIDSLGSVLESHAVVLQAPLDAAAAAEAVIAMKVDRSELAGIPDAVVESGKVSEIIRGDNLRDMPLNGGIPGNGLFHLSPKDELGEMFSGQNNNDSLPNLAPSHMAQCMFQFFNEESTNFSFHAPWQSVPEYGGRVVPVSYIRATAFNSPMDLNLFEPVRVNAAGLLAFKYKGTQPLYTIIQGGFTYLRRIFSVATERRIREILYLKPVDNVPSWEVGQNSGGSMFLGCSLASGDPAPQALNKDEFTDILGNTTDTLEADLLPLPELFTAAIPGYITANAPDVEELPSNDDKLTPEENANLRTTNWFAVTGGGVLRMNPIGGTSTRRRVQIKIADGTIYYSSTMSATDTAKGLFRIPIDAVEMRVYYRGPSDTATGMSIKMVPSNTSLLDILGGMWTKKTIMVHKDVVFYPGVTYAFMMMGNFYGSGHSNTYDFAWRVESGGLSFMFDASSMIKAKAKQLKAN